MSVRPVVLVGPTGAGKSDAALEIAAAHGATVVSMDAMQVYRGMDIGTAKVSVEIRAAIPHRCIDIRNLDEPFSAADFVAEADAAASTGPVVLCGGTPFYLRAWLCGLVPAPPVDLALRAALEALPDPHARLQEVDPVLAARLHPNDRVRVVRGLEIHALTGRPLSALHAEDPHERRDAEVIWIDRDDLYERLDERVDAMMAAGYLEEVRGLLDQGWSRELKPMLSLGYRYLAAHLAGELPLDEAVRLTKRDTRHLARKQRGFLRSMGFFPRTDVKETAARAFLQGR
ncbi:MAG: tRNA (adenosine(37)-N6)-dimethylallyltransferase MiaA [Pseudomonadota bacterium]|nr:tRNA (adenosine(37)-N6)-dimethylallyltransferase MiaA [Pseudomonadota bacterium]